MSDLEIPSSRPPVTLGEVAYWIFHPRITFQVVFTKWLAAMDISETPKTNQGILKMSTFQAAEELGLIVHGGVRRTDWPEEDQLRMKNGQPPRPGSHPDHNNI